MADIPGKSITEENEITAFAEGNDYLVVARDLTSTNHKIESVYLKRNMVSVESKTIASGEISTVENGAIAAYTVDTEGAVASDDLTKINGGYPGQIVVLQATDSARTVVIKDGANIRCAGGADFSLDHINDKWMGIFVSANNVDEISRSNNS